VKAGLIVNVFSPNWNACVMCVQRLVRAALRESLARPSGVDCKGKVARFFSRFTTENLSESVKARWQFDMRHDVLS